MTDYGRPVEFGYFLVPDAGHPADVVRTGESLDALGFDLVGIQDHPYQAQYLDTWTLLATIAARTARLRVFPAVVSLPLRDPAVLAKSAASLDLLSGGRVELGLGAGAFWDAIEAMGGVRRSPGAAVAALSEAIDVITLMWSDQRAVHYAGQHYRLSGLHPGPRPAHPVGLWLGAYKPKMLALVGEKATGWVVSAGYLPQSGLNDANARIDEAAVAAGRDPASIRRIYSVDGDFESARWIELITGLVVNDGIDGFLLSGPPEPGRLSRFAREVVPAVREAVATERAARA